MTPEQAKFWQDFCDATGRDTTGPADIYGFGDSPGMADELLDLILIGQKTATCALARWYQLPGERLPEAGDLNLILDGRDKPRAVIKLTSVEVKPLSEADARFAFDEGEGERTLDWWRAAHIEFWQREAEREGFVFSENMDVAFERFSLVWPAPK